MPAIDLNAGSATGGSAESRPPAAPAQTPTQTPPLSPGALDAAPLDDTAETVPDTAATLAEAVARRAEVLLLAQQSRQQMMQLQIDRMKDNFNATQEERSEQLREMNALRDMALAQAKQDDEVLKKYIAMI
ncbi:MAG: hypothetical protein GIX03_11925 [Candidatus Eremiobacteraeota bacterium]|nr:hypothetical protein [Candidatus Eremiobacteraeota bacterium]MBC5803675.1 hypothetical protein [Candidatus Eremiobacteraeota bacterium]MBC5821490.1 hypothetical protein [Candidatus Eremiobacteraeota bacterium]